MVWWMSGCCWSEDEGRRLGDEMNLTGKATALCIGFGCPPDDVRIVRICRAGNMTR
jgi:hypothetical protein